jgi:transcriptional regulator with XRE-family HTH domain
VNHEANIIGGKVSKLRYQRNWSQVTLVARLQVQRCKITRDILANIETKRTTVTDKHIVAFVKAFGVNIAELFLP